MATHDYDIANAAGATVRLDLNSVLSAIVTWNSNGTSPATTFARMRWIDTTTNTVKRRNSANSAWVLESTQDETRVLARSSNTILDISDIGKQIYATGTFTQTFDAAATLGDGWGLFYRNEGTGFITLDPNGAEQIDGAATLLLNPGEGCYISCNGSALKTCGLNRAWRTGDAKLTFQTSAEAGWIMANDGSIGSAASGATTRANADTLSLYTLLWNNVTNTWAPVSGGRGASASADFSANKTLTIPRVLGRAIAISGSGASLSARALGEFLGAETHTLSASESGLPAHLHAAGTLAGTVTNVGMNATGGALTHHVTDSAADEAATAASVTISGSTGTVSAAAASSAHPNMQPSSFWNATIKL